MLNFILPIKKAVAKANCIQNSNKTSEKKGENKNVRKES